MKQKVYFLLALFISISAFASAQTPADFYAGKWEIMIYSSPMGDIKFTTELVRKDGKLTGELSMPDYPDREKRAITKVEENGDNIKIFFNSPQSGGDVAIDLKKENDTTLRGKTMEYETVAKRINE
jgi:hypothetical protein